MCPCGDGCNGCAVKGPWGVLENGHINVLYLGAVNHFLVCSMYDLWVCVDRGDRVRQYCHSVIHKPTGWSPLPRAKPSGSSGTLVGTQKHSLSVAHIQNKLNWGADLLSRGNFHSAEQSLHPLVVEEIGLRVH